MFYINYSTVRVKVGVGVSVVSVILHEEVCWLFCKTRRVSWLLICRRRIFISPKTETVSQYKLEGAYDLGGFWPGKSVNGGIWWGGGIWLYTSTTGELRVIKSLACDTLNYFPSLVLWDSCFGDRKGIWPVKSWMLVCWWWWFDWRLCMSYSSSYHITASILSSNKVQNKDILLPT